MTGNWSIGEMDVTCYSLFQIFCCATLLSGETVLTLNVTYITDP
jgi:hypothetical protein